MALSTPPIWKQAPFLQFLFPFVLGIIAGWEVLLFSDFEPLLAVSAFIVVAGLIYIPFHLAGRKLKKYTGVVVFFILFLFGCLLSWWSNESLRSDFAGHFLKDSSWIKVKLAGPLTEKENSWKAKVEVLAVANAKKVNLAHAKAFLYFEKESRKPDLRYGDVLLIPNNLQPIKNSGNPGAFDYKSYCRAKHVWFSGYLLSGEWTVLEQNKGSMLKSFFIQARAACVKTIERYIDRPREAGIAEALLLGYENNLEDELVQAFANVGVVHLIAISGMHVALIYIVLLWLFRFVPLKSESVKGVFILVLLWSFTLLTGAHPSTLRATVMLSFFVLGKFFFHRTVNKYNILAASAFILLCFDPYLFFDVGFQLSYLAVAGILIFQRPVEALFCFKHKLGNYIWKMMSVSIAAQLLAFPLALYYFHQFPVFFLLSNLMLIPAVTFVLYGEIVLLALSFIPAVAKFIGIVLTKSLVIINESILWAGNFHYIKWEYSGLHLFGMLLLYVIIAMLAVWLFYRDKKALFTAMVMLTILGFNAIVQKWQIVQQQKIIVYQIAGHSAIEWVAGQQSQFFSDSIIWKNADIMQYALNPSSTSLGIKNRRKEKPAIGFFQIFNKEFLVLRNTFDEREVNGLMPVDYVIVSCNNHLEMEEIAKHFSPQTIIFDASVEWWQNEKWKTACKQLNLHCFSVPDRGAWILSMK